jgi:hypothetical protein
MEEAGEEEERRDSAGQRHSLAQGPESGEGRTRLFGRCLAKFKSSSFRMRARGPKCKICGKGIQLLSLDSSYVKIVKPGESKGIFICFSCAEKILGEKLQELLK